jgi:hypothetical protein
MSDFVAAIFLGIFELMLVLFAALVGGLLWCLAVAAFAGIRFGAGGVTVARRRFRRRTTERELAMVAVEYQRAVSDIRAIARTTQRRIRGIGRELER